MSLCERYYIFRLPQVVGRTNSPTLVNFLIDAIQNNRHFKVQKNATRNLIDVRDVCFICNKIITDKVYLNETVNVASPFNVKVINIVKTIERILGENAEFCTIEQGMVQDIKIDRIKKIGISHLFNKNYLEQILIDRIKCTTDGRGEL